TIRGASNVDGLHDVIVREPGSGFSFLIESVNEFRIFAQLPRQNLYGHDTVERYLAGFVNRRHRAFAKFAQELVAGNLGVLAAVFGGGADALGLIGGDETVF